MRAAALLLALVVGCAGGSAVPGDVLDERAFWQLVARTGSGPVEDRAAVLGHLLAAASARRLESWQRQLVARDEELNTRALKRLLDRTCGPQDPDAFAADRSWLVAHGQQVFMTARNHPTELTGLDGICEGSGEAFADAATALYSDLGFEPGTEAFPFVGTSPPR
ncbi:MAG: DUF4240 domain-containing protein [Mycobacteriales bacterium]